MKQKIELTNTGRAVGQKSMKLLGQKLEGIHIYPHQARDIAEMMELVMRDIPNKRMNVSSEGKKWMAG